MPYRGKPSKNCADCRRRKIKCDLKLPGCTQCSNAGLECEGYRNQLDLMFLDENERTENSVLKRSKCSRTTATDTGITSSAPSRKSSPTLATIIDLPSTSRSLSSGSSSREIRVQKMKRRSPSIGPPKTTRAREKKSRTTTPEEAEDRTEARSRATSKAALHRTISAQHSAFGNYPHPLDEPVLANFHQQPRQYTSAADSTSCSAYGFELASSITTPYTEVPSFTLTSTSSAKVPSMDLPMSYSLNPDVTYAPNSMNPAQFSMPSAQTSIQSCNLPQQSKDLGRLMQTHRPLHQQQYQQELPLQFPGDIQYEQKWVHGVQAPPQRGYTQHMSLATHEEWLPWGEFQPQYQQQPPQQWPQQGE